MDLKNDFVEMVKAQHPEEQAALLDALDNFSSTTSVRYNLKKGRHDGQNEVPWCQHAQYLDERKSFTLDPLLHGGGYYVQDASSMFIYFVLNFLKIPKKGRVLDLCGAPGGKSTLILDYMENEGILVANEVIKSRANILQENIIKWGHNNAIVTNNDPSDFKKLTGYFDTILVDAPCSGEGMFRKDHGSRQEWSLDHIELCKTRQQRILDDIYSSLKSEGYLIYSTCTFNHEENIKNVEYFIEKYKFEAVELPIQVAWGIVPVILNKAIGYQFFPSKVKGEGFFISVLKKKEEAGLANLKAAKIPKLKSLTKVDLLILHQWVCTDVILMQNDMGNVYAYNELLAEDMNKLINNFMVKHSGVLVGNLQKNVFVPEHNLALSSIVSATVPCYEMDLLTARKYLHKSLLSIDHPQKGWLLVKHEGISLGWLKNLGNRINNYYPSEWRIRMSIE